MLVAVSSAVGDAGAAAGSPSGCSAGSAATSRSDEAEGNGGGSTESRFSKQIIHGSAIVKGRIDEKKRLADEDGLKKACKAFYFAAVLCSGAPRALEPWEAETLVSPCCRGRGGLRDYRDWGEVNGE